MLKVEKTGATLSSSARVRFSFKCATCGAKIVYRSISPVRCSSCYKRIHDASYIMQNSSNRLAFHADIEPYVVGK